MANADPAETHPYRGVALPDSDRGGAPAVQRPRQEQLRDLFGEPERWGQTLRNLLWTNTSAVIPRFTGTTTVDLQVPCTFDFNVATTKYFNGLADGDIPVCLMFSGTVFYADAAGSLQRRPNFLGEGDEIPPAAEDLAGHDGSVLPQQRLAVPSPGRL